MQSPGQPARGTKSLTGCSYELDQQPLALSPRAVRRQRCSGGDSPPSAPYPAGRTGSWKGNPGRSLASAPGPCHLPTGDLFCAAGRSASQQTPASPRPLITYAGVLLFRIPASGRWRVNAAVFPVPRRLSARRLPPHSHSGRIVETVNGKRAPVARRCRELRVGSARDCGAP